MGAENILDYLAYLLPSVVVAGIAYYFFKTHTAHFEQLKRFEISAELKKNALPIRLQAYERLCLFLERIAPGNLVPRIKPFSDNKHDYENLLIRTIEQEFEHNLAQQIYISERCWSIIVTAKNATIQMIRLSAINEKVTNADGLRELVLSDLIDKPSPSSAALSFIKDEVGQLW
jgi:DNA-binding Xre family transcriptional regulator